MFDDYCDWAANHPTLAWLVFIVFMGCLAAAIVAIAWPRQLPDLNNPNDFGC